MLIYLLKENIRRNILTIVFLSILFTLVFSIFYYLMSAQIFLHNQQTQYSQNLSSDYIRIAFNQEYAPFYSKNNGEMPVKTMYEKLVGADIFEYYEVNYQHLRIFNYHGTPIFKEGYEDGNTYDDVSMELNGVQYPTAVAIKTAQLSRNCFSNFNLKVSEGRDFSEDDYFYAINDTVPVILGSEYKGQYEIGDMLQGIYLAEPFQFEVVGFLEKDSYIQVVKDIQYLDRYIIMPFFNCEKPVNEQDRVFQIRHYGAKTSGMIKPLKEISVKQIERQINQIARKNGLKNYSVWSVKQITASSADQVIVGQKALFGFLFLCAAVILFSSVFLIMIFNRRILNYLSVYWAYWISGVDIITIKRAVRIEIFFILLVSDLLCFVFQSLLYSMPLLLSISRMVVQISFAIWIITAYGVGKFLNKSMLKNAGEELKC